MTARGAGLTSRAATDELLAVLRQGRWRPSAWARFTALSAQWSARQARLHPRALAELTALHAVFAVLAGRPGRRWTAVSWVLAVSHLGMLEARPSVGLPGTVTLLRANLPVIWHRQRRARGFAGRRGILDLVRAPS